MTQYNVLASHKIFERIKTKLVSQTKKLRKQCGFWTATDEELIQEAVIIFFKHFEDYYEEDNKYLRFLFIATKNRIRTMQKETYTYINRYKNSPNNSDNDSDYYTDLEKIPAAQKEMIDLKDILSKLSKRKQKMVLELIDNGGNWIKMWTKFGVTSWVKREKIKRKIQSVY